MQIDVLDTREKVLQLSPNALYGAAPSEASIQQMRVLGNRTADLKLMTSRVVLLSSWG